MMIVTMVMVVITMMLLMMALVGLWCWLASLARYW